MKHRVVCLFALGLAACTAYVLPAGRVDGDDAGVILEDDPAQMGSEPPSEISPLASSADAGTAVDARTPLAEAGPRADARSADAARADGPVEAVNAGINCAAARFCDEFENHPVGAAPGGSWTLNRSGGTLQVDSTKAFSGTKSIRITSPAAGGANLELRRPTLPFPGNVFYGRMMLWVGQVPPGGVHWLNVHIDGPLPTGTRASYTIGAMYEKLLPTYEPPECGQSTNVRYPLGRWFCMQWQVDGSSDGAEPKDELRIWFDGKPVVAIIKTGNWCVGGSARWRAPRIDRARIGWVNAHKSPIPIEMWIDDVAFDTKPIACPTAP